MSFEQGGGGGRAKAEDEISLYGLDRPYDLSGFSPETLQQINEMFDLLFRNMTRTETNVITTNIRIDNISSGWTKVTKAADQSNDTQTLAADTELTVLMAPNSLYHIRGAILVEFDNLDDHTSVFDVTVAVSKSWIRRWHSASATSINTLNTFPTTAINFTSATNGGIVFDAIILNSTTASSFQYQFAKINNNPPAPAKVLKGSYLEYFRAY